MRTLRWALLMMLILAPLVSLAQSKKIPVAVNHSGDDQVGQSLAFALKETIRASQSFTLVDHVEAPTTARIVVSLVSLDQEVTERKGVSSSIAVAIVYDSIKMPAGGAFLTMLVQACGRDRADSCAKNLLPVIDREVETLRRAWPNLWKTLGAKN